MDYHIYNFMASTGSSSSAGKSAGFMAGYMSDLSQSQDMNSFLQKNQPTYNPSVSNTSSSTSSGTAVSGAKGTNISPESNQESPESSKTSPASEPTKKPFDSNTPVGSHPLPNAHSIYQRHAIQTAAMDNCADLNMELTDCLLGKAGTWWDRASMCMKAKEKFGKCCRLNREVLEAKGYAQEGNTPEQDRTIMDYADDVTQKAIKEDKA
ncbi:hypothetical protein BGX28_007666 [Mortierella sp. GBA30]|nr:hypothetical protein BGX28_007666 [Mortierella sp. GBA30]